MASNPLLKDLKELAAQRDQIEKEIEELTKYLNDEGT